jgi:uncharacterized protein YbbK (DUF523 family)
VDSSETDHQERILVGISSCLVGEKVRFDGGHKQNRYVLDTLGKFFRFRPFCPEMAIGLGVPRETIRLVSIDGRTEAVGNKTAELNVTRELIQSAEDQRDWHSQIFGYIVKKDSPSCGMERVRVYHGEQPQRSGVGLSPQTPPSHLPPPRP